MKRLLLLLLIATSTRAACTGSSPTWTTTPDSASVQTCITNATAGDTINISSGSASWGLHSVVLAKALTLNGAGIGVTNITVTAHSTFDITKQSAIIRIKNLTFIAATGANTLPHPITINGPWPTGQPVIFQNVAFSVNDDTPIDNFVAGGTIFSRISFASTHYGDFFMTVKDLTHTTSWTTADSLGMNDSSGLLNVYVEDSTFSGGANGVFDCDDNCRIVIRHNTFSESGGFNSHGHDSSPYGMREFEIYNNSFLYPDKTCAAGTTSLSNIGSYVWIRGATGVIYNNTMDHLTSTCWGTKGEFRMNNRGAEDDRPGGISCTADTYPVNHQIGQNNNGSADFTDPIWYWNNVGNASAPLQAGSGWAWGNPCGFNWNTYFQWGRDAQNTSLPLPITLSSNGGSVSALGGTPKPGYTAFTYPHPLVAPSSSPQLSFSPNFVTFGNVTVAATASQVVTITNVGTATQTFTSIVLTPSQNTNGNTGLAGQCPASGTILAGANCTVKVVFQPTAATTYSGTLTMNGTATSAISVTGTGVSSISIPAAPTSLTTGVTGSTVNLTWVASTGTPTGYNVLRGTVTGGPYTTIATLGVATSYADTSRPNGTYFYRVNAFNSAGTSPNSNEASATVSTACSINLSPSFLTLPNTTLGATSASSPFTLTNNGTASCTSVVVANPTGTNGADFAQSNACPGTIAVLGTCTVNVTFTPSLVGVESAAIAVTSNDPNSPDTELLQGTGTTAINVSPTSLSFGRTFVNKSSASQTVTFTNTSGGAVTISAAITGGDSSQFTKGADTCTGSIANLSTCTTAVTFTPTTTGNKASSLVFTYTGAPGSPITVPLTGTGTTHKVRKGVIL